MATTVDHAEIKLGQLITIGIATLDLLFNDQRWLVALGAIFLVTGFFRPLSPFVLLYRFIIRPLKIMHSDYRLDNIQPHAFGQLVGAITVAFALGLYHFEYHTAAMVIVTILIGLTLISYLGWCIGCFMYYQINRLGFKGFFSKKPTDTSVIPGQRPNTRINDKK